MMPQPVFLLDASIYIFRAYFALPDNWHSPEGYPVNALYGYTKFLLNYLDQQQPQQVAAAFDESLGTCFRNELHPEYKCSRVLPDETLAFQLSACKAVTSVLGVPSFASSRFEADDIIATLAYKARGAGRSVVILSKDKDLGQLLVNTQDKLYDPATGTLLDQVAFKKKYGIAPKLMIDYQMLVGDRIDDIPGVPGIGSKTACLLVNQFGTVDHMLKRLDDIAAAPIRGARSIASKLENFQSQFEITRQLLTLRNDVALGRRSNQLKWKKPKRVNVEAFFNEFGLTPLIKQLDKYSWL